MELGEPSWTSEVGCGGLASNSMRRSFRENTIDDTVLPRLTAEDLKDLGADLSGIAVSCLTPSPPCALKRAHQRRYPTRHLATDKAAQDTAERRQVTVMFSDLVGSTALSARMDPEDLREIIAAYHKCVAEIVRRFDGFVAKYLGDGVLVYFGYPQAHEDDAERAVRAGLELIAAVSWAQNARVAANPCRHCHRAGCGRRPDGFGRARRSAASSARRRTSLRACKGSPSRTWSSSPKARESFSAISSSLQDLGAKDLKGIAGPVRAWAALRASSVESRFEALHASGLTALVGREEEIELLLRRWARAKSGEGQVVLLSGEAGIGKSRLTAALLERLAGERAHALALFLLAAAHGQCVLSDHRPDGTRRRTGARRHAASEARQARCGSRADLDFDEDAALFAEMLSLAERWALSRARADPAAAPAKNAGSADLATRGADPPASRC